MEIPAFQMSVWLTEYQAYYLAPPASLWPFCENLCKLGKALMSPLCRRFGGSVGQCSPPRLFHLYSHNTVAFTPVVGRKYLFCNHTLYCEGSLLCSHCVPQDLCLLWRSWVWKAVWLSHRLKSAISCWLISVVLRIPRVAVWSSCLGSLPLSGIG